METSNYGPIDIAISGLRTQEQNINLISSNVANAHSTESTDGQLYRRLEAIFKAKSDPLGGVEIDKITEDMSDFPVILKPDHPNADRDGYVTMSNVNLPVEMMNLNVAARVYQANVAVLKRYQRMVETTLELLR